MNKGLKKGISIVFFANIINLIFSLSRNFILPKYLSFETYADIKTYQLFISYSGLFAMGYVDGMYLKYGGKNINDINIKEFLLNFSTFRIFQILVTLINVSIAVYLQDIILLMVALTIPFLTIVDYFKCFFQAVGEFFIYSKLLNLSSVMMFIISIILIFILKRVDSYSYIIAYTIIYGFIAIIIELYLHMKKKYKIKYLKFSYLEMKSSIASGFALMISLLIFNFMTGLDRWFVKFTLDTISFAHYSFATSVLGFLSYAVSPISITMYNYFCKERDNHVIKKLKQAIILFSVIIVVCVFPVKFILEVYLIEYIKVLFVIIILFAEQVPNTIVRCFYVNLYKAEKKQRIFLMRVVTTVIMGIVLNIISYFFNGGMEGYAIATGVSSVGWLILSMLDFKAYMLEIRETLFVFFSILTFLICGICLKSYIGIIVYIIFVLIYAKGLMPNSLNMIIELLSLKKK